MRPIMNAQKRKKMIQKYLDLHCPPGRRLHLYTDPYIEIEGEEYDDYNTDGNSPIDEEPEYDVEEELYLLYRNNVLKKIN